MVVHSRSTDKRYVQRIAIIVIFTLAWAWIAAVGIVLFHTSTQPPAPKRMGGFRRHHIAGDEPVDPQRVTEPVLSLPKFESPTLIFTCSRADYLDKALLEVLKYMPRTCEIGCPIIVSQDGENEAVKKVIQKHQKQNHEIPIFHIQHEKSVQRGVVNPYEALATHYGWGLQQTFSGKAYSTDDKYPAPQRLIILEEDIRVAPDFFEYFKATAPLLDTDPTLMAVSAFNDNGIRSNVMDASRIVRSDFFPGLGWMMAKSLWDTELSSKWPTSYWDDWLREPAQRQGRHFLRPEVSRTFHFGVKGGASSNQFGGTHSQILLNNVAIDWKHEDLTYLYPATFDQEYWNLISTSIPETDFDLAKEHSKAHNVRIEYANLAAFQRLAQQLGLMDDEKAGVPRTAFKGVIESRPHGNHILFLTPPLSTVKKDFHQSR